MERNGKKKVQSKALNSFVSIYKNKIMRQKEKEDSHQLRVNSPQ